MASKHLLPSEAQLHVSGILKAFLDSGAGVQKAVREQVMVATSPTHPEEDRRKAEAAIAEALRLGTNAAINGRTASAEERLTPAVKAALHEMDQEESLFANRVAGLMAERGLTQAELAHRVGVSQPAISLILSRRCRPHPRTVGKIAAALGLAVTDLWPGEL